VRAQLTRRISGSTTLFANAVATGFCVWGREPQIFVYPAFHVHVFHDLQNQ
jgi:hypothetical protein